MRAKRENSSTRRRRPSTSWMIDLDRKSTRLNSSHVRISYAVFCLKKKKKKLESILVSVAGRLLCHTFHYIRCDLTEAARRFAFFMPSFVTYYILSRRASIMLSGID